MPTAALHGRTLPPQEVVVLPSRRLIVTIDGPAGTGKSTSARQLAHRLGLDFLDTGAMYRAAALAVIDDAIPLADHVRIETRVRTARIHFDWRADPPAVLIDNADVSARIRGSDVTRVVSPVSAIPAVRAVMVREQRRIAEEHPRLVTEGRDQGTVVFPDAEVKFYLDADPAVRARRRADEIARRTGSAPGPDQVSAVLHDILERDARDSSRPDGPLRRPADAILIDTSALDLHQVVDRLESEARARIASLA